MARQRSVQGLITIVLVNAVLMENVWTALDVRLRTLPAGVVGEGYLEVEVAVALEVATGLPGHGVLWQGA